MFFGYYLSAAVMVARGERPARARAGPPDDRSLAAHLDPVRALVPVLTAHARRGIPLGDIIADSGYAHRDAEAWAIPLRRAGAQLVQDLHPHDRGPRGTHQGAIIANGNLYCPATPSRCWNSARCRPAPRRGRRRARPADRRARPAQARPAHRRRRRRLPPRHLPRRRRQDPLPAPPGVDEPGPRPARDPDPARAPARLLHPADHHRPARRSRPRPGRNTTTPQRRTGGTPTPGAPAPSAPSPPSRTPPPPASPAAGAASSA